MAKKPSQSELILNLFRTKKIVTSNELRHYGGFRYTARVYDLRKLGHKIELRNRTKRGFEYEYVGSNEREGK